MPQMNNISFILPDARWLDAPAEKTPNFTKVYTAVARAVQTSLRETVPGYLFQDLKRLENLEDGYPILVFHSSRLCAKTSFSYDVLDRAAMNKFFRLTARELVPVLAEASATLEAAGYPELADLYHPRRAAKIIRAVQKLKKYRKPLNQMLVSEGRLITELIRLSGSRYCDPKVRAQKQALFIRNWNICLKRFYMKRDFTAIAPAVLRAATQALVQASSAEILDIAA